MCLYIKISNNPLLSPALACVSCSIYGMFILFGEADDNKVSGTISREKIPEG
jgi:hypothetical protein